MLFSQQGFFLQKPNSDSELLRNIYPQLTEWMSSVKPVEARGLHRFLFNRLSLLNLSHSYPFSYTSYTELKSIHWGNRERLFIQKDPSRQIFLRKQNRQMKLLFQEAQQGHDEMHPYIFGLFMYVRFYHCTSDDFLSRMLCNQLLRNYNLRLNLRQSHTFSNLKELLEAFQGRPRALYESFL